MPSVNKPLTKGERELIERFNPFGAWRWSDMDKLRKRLLEAEAYWREAVKNAEWDVGGEIHGMCGFCKERVDRESDHALDCPWVWAQ